MGRWKETTTMLSLTFRPSVLQKLDKGDKAAPTPLFLIGSHLFLHLLILEEAITSADVFQEIKN